MGQAEQGGWTLDYTKRSHEHLSKTRRTYTVCLVNTLVQKPFWPSHGSDGS